MMYTHGRRYGLRGRSARQEPIDQPLIPASIVPPGCGYAMGVVTMIGGGAHGSWVAPQTLRGGSQ